MVLLPPAQLQERLGEAGDVVRVHRTAYGQLVAGVGDEHDGLAEEEQGRQLCPEGAAAGPGDHGQLHDAVEEHLEEELVVARPQRAIDRGILPHELRKGGPEKATRERAESAEPDAAALAGLGEARGIGPLPHDLEGAARVWQEALAGGRQRDAAAADEEDRADVFLERLDPRADRRLPDAERDRGAAEASLADDLVEGGKPIEIHGWRVYRRFRCKVSAD